MIEQEEARAHTINKIFEETKNKNSEYNKNASFNQEKYIIIIFNTEMRLFTCKRIGRMPSTTRRSKRDWANPALAAFLHITTGPSWQWSPTKISCTTMNNMLLLEKKKRFNQNSLKRESFLMRYIFNLYDSVSKIEITTCFAPNTTGTIHSGSVACVLSSIRIDRKRKRTKRGSPAPTHVEQITSACWNNMTWSRRIRM